MKLSDPVHVSLPFKGGKGPVKRQGAYPTKTTINLVGEASQGNTRLQIGLFVLFMLILFILVKFFVVDPLAVSAQTASEVNKARSELSSLQAQTKDFESINSEYSRYVVTGLNEDEMSAYDRSKIIDSVEANFAGFGTLTGMTIKGNVVTVECSGVDLNAVSEKVTQLESNASVAHVTVSTAREKEGAEQSASFQITYAEPATGGSNTQKAGE